ncbi:gamma-glutamylcyclotransferase [Aneurinibacillus sp. Ricciae_BoGa-3]|uniref:gamma-glutamylcyclotransferase family protein n=1 Tax=Aneurinibacillus sp. Ricciae_BoGa-3 TaxID=3022697 RepID=UPI002340E833|nr:gamma-glutamylcyclotransferase family protein [Aneurinibacillus sp. Ricciae_BoGa-3]WCK55160.1 gamma-glutamylcyclotransferase [Aneurinibacillus sp. Ricciae_BoGa-3]
MEHVFVYGTLRQGEGNYHYLAGSTRVALSARMNGRLVDTGYGYPALIQNPECRVNGEVYAVDDETMLHLDRLEGYYGPGDCRNHYERVNIPIETDYGTVLAWTYVYASDRFERGFTNIEEGDWKLYHMLQKPKIFYFAYGSCMDMKRMEEAGVQEFFQNVNGRGVLDGFNLQFTRKAEDGGRADIVESGGSTEGKVYDIPVEAVKGYLYGREGVLLGLYRPVVVSVRMRDGSTCEALTFVVVNKEEETAPPVTYMEEILRGARPVVSEAYYNGLVDRFVSRFGYPIHQEELM